MSRHHRTILSAAALRTDAGYNIAHDRPKHALYLIKTRADRFSEASARCSHVARYTAARREGAHSNTPR